MNESHSPQPVAEVGVQPLGCPSDPASSTPLRQFLAGHLPPEHPLSPRRAYRVFPPLTQGIVCYEPAWLWDQDTAALPSPLAELRRQSRQFADQELRPRA